VLDRELEDACAQMVKDLIARFYFLVSRFTTSTFMRAKLGEALLRREVAPHTFESGAESRANLLRGPY
jgi:propionate CoA-transferase